QPPRAGPTRRTRRHAARRWGLRRRYAGWGHAARRGLRGGNVSPRPPEGNARRRAPGGPLRAWRGAGGGAGGGGRGGGARGAGGGRGRGRRRGRAGGGGRWRGPAGRGGRWRRWTR